ncbi:MULTISPECIES: PssD/Cps14F family polysaccharide biosynthesis glycosyltransferase [Priestia]|uniref:PssD/Cps14F family polysaccharide biosynthesis glycosyltransferase n=1 Tax=Priestia TaxID=2800373 RepID=UPI0021D649A1|nr:MULTISPECIES: PssD/Cps14F family polysaccharide biosynthesis glycosyltransferase [Priestia]MCU7710176.1 UDP-N-acetylglucosamine transferase subunit ALG14 [Priestia megaterium]MCW1044494.1 UDP-N-acetylglucosamine transferase subunit ALG14 [Priestia sp. JV24]MEB4870870.1 PssD/Cps14F family polysaccharide biosynthesis glycosyltransferase [Priestia megaterium]MEB4888180.1 PssD/Cps14F family polysaccharide biosynthesis glycosyltransferase [Priestia megaterium]
MKQKTKKVCLISSSGGHLEQIKQLKEITARYDYFYVVTRTKATEAMQQKKYIVSDLIRTNKFVSCVRMAKMMIEQFGIFLKERPDVIITTGAAVAIPMCLIGKIFKRKVIYIESFARINTPNKTGQLIYKFADLFIIQWEELEKHYPEAVYGGSIY